MKIQRLVTNICSDQVALSKDFYVKLLGLEVRFDSDWFVNLGSKDSNYEIGIVQRDHEIVPKDFQQSPRGFYLTFVVESADEAYRIAQEEGFTVVQAPHDTFYGQRRLLLQDPDGALVDISSLIPDFQFGG